MKKLINSGLLIIVCIFVLIFGACTSVRVPTEYGIHGMISRIEYGDNVVYMFGSMHAGFRLMRLWKMPCAAQTGLCLKPI